MGIIPFVTPFAKTIMSGVTLKIVRQMQNLLPKPVITSSKISNILCSSKFPLLFLGNQLVELTPVEPAIGSIISAAILKHHAIE